MISSPPKPEACDFTFDQLQVNIYRNRAEMGHAAAAAAASYLQKLLVRRKQARVIFACAPSQNEFLAELTRIPEIPWSRITAFHMDEYVGLSALHPASFRSYLRDHVTAQVTPKLVHELAGDAANPEAECARYSRLLAAEPIDAVFLGIGENGHLAFNDPPVADFQDPEKVKIVELDRACREQQVNDGCFSTLSDVPQHALTLTIPTLTAAKRMFCIVPGTRKAAAVEKTLYGKVTTKCPASILRNHGAATLFLDKDSGASILSRRKLKNR